MSNKKKQLKLNTHIRKYFDGDGFDDGIERLDLKKLSEFAYYVGIDPQDMSKDALVKLFRRLWSESDIELRRVFLEFFHHDGIIYLNQKDDHTTKENTTDKDEKIESYFKELSHYHITKEEKAEIFATFAEVRVKKITIDKIISKLNHIRYEKKRNFLEKSLDGVFDFGDCFEFNTPLEYKIFDQSFKKIHTLKTEQFSFTFLNEAEVEEIIKEITEAKQNITEQKQHELNLFLNSLHSDHRYLSTEKIIKLLKTSDPSSNPTKPDISADILETILKAHSSNIEDITFSGQDVIISVMESYSALYGSKTFAYTLHVTLEKEVLLDQIWNSKEIDLSQIAIAKKYHEEHFESDLKILFDECKLNAQLLQMSDEQIYLKLYDFLATKLDGTLEISHKLYTKAQRAFHFSIQDDLLKRQRQELLAKTIRDFKNLFPLARELRRKLVLHIGPTNSGKTYSAMQSLKSASTGYYLAPLRLLALEGYENLKELGADVSLITGEEQLINPDATHISSTIEMINTQVDVDICVIDEVQMIDDRDRGWAWANAIIGAPAKKVIMTGSSNVKQAIIDLAHYLNEPLEIIEFERKNPLSLLPYHTPLDHIESSSAVIAFSRKDVLKLKQQLSNKYKISVVYGNLSPEVRREEARRFREGESEILIATDAIAMGLNLPIKTILFYKDEKFDGENSRSLSASEIHQISGRAGRYGLNEKGYVGALSKQVLHRISTLFYEDAKPISIPFKVMANLEHIKLVGAILEENSLKVILEFFVKNMQFNGPFRASNLDSMLELATMIDSYDLDISTKYFLASSPMSTSSPYLVRVFDGYLQLLEKKSIVHYEPPIIRESYASTMQDLLQAEDMVKEISLYLWLNYRFNEIFVDAQKARESRSILNKFIENSLKESHFVPKCKLCSKNLPPESEFAICDSCFRKSHTRPKPFVKKRVSRK